jgi:hypothetical protein
VTTTLAAARRALRERLDEKTARQWPDTALDRWLHEGAKDMARKCEVLQDTAAIDATAGDQTYALPTDMVRIYRATWQNDNDTTLYPLEYRDFNSADAVWWTQQAITQGTPAIFTMWGVLGSVEAVLYPTPAVNGTLNVYYYRLPTVPTSDTAALDIPNGWEDTMYSYAEYRALMMDRDPRWQQAKAIYDEQIMDMMSLTRRYSDQQGQTFAGQYPAINGWLYEFD